MQAFQLTIVWDAMDMNSFFFSSWLLFNNSDNIFQQTKDLNWIDDCLKWYGNIVDFIRKEMSFMQLFQIMKKSNKTFIK